jgi:6-phosphogluconolactonase/glucosamine-6-phosphate isomerase/deaminase
MLFVVEGADKKGILTRVLSGEDLSGQDLSGQDLPARRAYSNGDLVWLVDRAAAPTP